MTAISRQSMFAFALGLGIGVLNLRPAAAVDGVIEINQAKVAAAGGFPFTISNN